MNFKDRLRVFWDEINRSNSKYFIIGILVLIGLFLFKGLLSVATEPKGIIRILVQYPVFIMAIVFHECAHGLSALWFGDDTALRAGRLTLNPIRHLDPAGTIVFIVTSLMGVGFGWARPVPVNPRKFKNHFWGETAVSLAGVGANLLFAMVLWGLWLSAFRPLVLRLADRVEFQTLLEILLQLFTYGIMINFVLLVFNLIPIPPLDGSHVLRLLLPPRLQLEYDRLAPFGFILIFVLLFTTPVFQIIFSPFMKLTFKMIYGY